MTHANGTTVDAALIAAAAHIEKLRIRKRDIRDELYRLQDQLSQHQLAVDAAEKAAEEIASEMDDVYTALLTMTPQTLDGLKAIASAVVMACWDGVVHTSNSADDRGIAKLMSALSGVAIDPVTPMITEACQVGDVVLGALFIIAALVMAWSAVTSARDRRELWRRVAEARRG